MHLITGAPLALVFFFVTCDASSSPLGLPLHPCISVGSKSQHFLSRPHRTKEANAWTRFGENGPKAHYVKKQHQTKKAGNSRIWAKVHLHSSNNNGDRPKWAKVERLGIKIQMSNSSPNGQRIQGNWAKSPSCNSGLKVHNLEGLGQVLDWLKSN